jgi:hypothetical protein
MRMRKKDRLKLGLDSRIERERFLAWLEALSRRGKVRILTKILAYERMQQSAFPCVSNKDCLAITPFEKSLVPEEFMPALLAGLTDPNLGDCSKFGER